MRALVIENNQAYRDLLEHTLAERGFTTDSGDSIETARSCVESDPYDIICVDQALKDGSGEEFVAYCNHH